MITSEVSGKYVVVRFKEDSATERYQEWAIPLLVIEDLKNWYPRKSTEEVQETLACRYRVYSSYIDIKRLDVYTLIHFVLPKIVVEHLIAS